MRPVLIVSIDTLRQDHMTPEFMPNLCGLGGLWLENVVVGGSWTVPSHTCLLTGQGPWRHTWAGTPPNRTRAALSHPTILSRLGERGYATAFWGADILANCRQAGEVWGGPGEGGQVADGQAGDILDFMWSNPHYAVFLHYWGAHAPYGIPNVTPVQIGIAVRDAHTREAVMGAYGDAVRRIDGELATILQQALLHDALILVTSDHGEDFGAGHPFGEKHFNYLWMHPMAWRPEAVLVKSVLLGAGTGRVEAQLRNYDLAPAMWKILFGEEMAGADGRHWMGESLPAERVAECWSTEWGMDIQTVRVDRGVGGHVTRLINHGGPGRWVWTPERGLLSTEYDWRWGEAELQARQERGFGGPPQDYSGVQLGEMLGRLRDWGYD